MFYFTKVERTGFLFVKVLLSEFTFLDVALRNQFFVDFHSLFGRNFYTAPILCLCLLVGKQRGCHHHRTIGAGFSHVGLQLLGKVVVTLTGNNCQDIGVEHMVAQYVCILTFALIVDA